MMGSRWLNLMILLLWLGSMSWLVGAKILPAYRVGKPPKYLAVLTEGAQQVDTGWMINVSGKPVGWSVSRVERGDAGALTVLSHVKLIDLPFKDIAMGFLGSMLRNEFHGDINAVITTQMYTGEDGRLVRFRSNIQLQDMAELISLDGAAADKSLDLVARCGSVRIPSRIPFDNNVVLTDELSPVSMMPGLQVGQSWTQPVISPLRPPNAPSEVLSALVERTDFIAWNGEPVSAFVVVYRSMGGNSSPAGQTPLAELWVRSDGLVLRHSTRLGKGELMFTRLGDRETKKLAFEAFDASLQKWQQEPARKNERDEADQNITQEANSNFKAGDSQAH